MIRKITLSVLIIVYVLLRHVNESAWNHLILIPFFILLFFGDVKNKKLAEKNQSHMQQPSTSEIQHDG